MFLNNIKMRQKLTFLLLVIGLLPTILVNIIAYATISTQLDTKTVTQLDSTAVKQGQKIDALLQSKQEETLILANRYDLQSGISNYLSGRAGSADSIATVLLATKDIDTNIQDIYVTNMHGNVMASTSSYEDGTIMTAGDDAVANGQENSVTIQPDPVDGTDKLYIVAQEIINQQDVGFVTLEFGLSDFLATTQDYTGLGNTGETVVVAENAKHQYISLFPLRFDSNAALKTDLSDLQITSHLGTTYTNVKDYRHKLVTVSAQAIGFANWSVATIIDNSEAYASVLQLQTTLSTIVLVLSVVIILISIYFSRYITAPIITLTEKTRNISHGDLNQRITVVSTDEVGTLATAFNDMTQSLQNSSRRLGEEQARLKASINSLNIGFLMTTWSGDIVSCNPAMYKLLGFEANEKNFSLEAIQAHLTDFDLMNAVKSCLAAGQSFSSSEASYSSRFLRVTGEPIRLSRDEIIGAVIVIEDITEERNLSRSKDEFFSIASHELRTPLTAIKGNTSMILDYYPQLLKDKNVSEMLNDIHASSVRLINIVNDFLDVSRLEMGKFVFEKKPFNVALLIQDTLREFDVTGSRKKLKLTYEQHSDPDGPWAMADEDRVRQIVINLIGNAFKVTEKGGISLSTHTYSDHVSITVTDTGIGIPLDSQHLLFHKFQQASNNILTRDNTQSTGLGLYISRLMAEGMAGKLYLDQSEVGKGSSFTLELPKSTKPAEETKPEKA